MTMPNPTPSFTELTDSQKVLVFSLALNELQKDVSVHNRLLVTGNGELPIPERLRTLEEYVTNVKFWARFIGTILIAQTISFTFGIWIAIIKFLPVLERIATTP
jgi:hypothetical protein